MAQKKKRGHDYSFRCSYVYIIVWLYTNVHTCILLCDLYMHISNLIFRLFPSILVCFHMLAYPDSVFYLSFFEPGSVSTKKKRYRNGNGRRVFLPVSVHFHPFLRPVLKSVPGSWVGSDVGCCDPKSSKEWAKTTCSGNKRITKSSCRFYGLHSTRSRLSLFSGMMFSLELVTHDDFSKDTTTK